MLALMLCGSLLAANGRAIETVQQPYIDGLLTEMREEDPDSFKTPNEALKVDGVAPQGSYLEELKEDEPNIFSHTEGPLKPVDPEPPAVSPIADTLAGRTRKSTEKRGTTLNAFGMRFNAFATRGFSATSSARVFSEIYSSSWYPEIMLFYERQLFHSENWGSVGLVGTVGFGYFYGKGVFAFELNKAWDPASSFGSVSQTSFSFLSFPAFVGLNYRLNLLRMFRPYAQAMVGGLGAAETRNDNHPTTFGYGLAFAFGGGVNFLLDWLNPGTSFELYDATGVQRYFLTGDMTVQTPLFGGIRYSNVAFSFGMTYEF